MQTNEQGKDYKSLGYSANEDNFSIEEYFDIEKILGGIECKKRIILQFPVEALGVAIKVQTILRKRLNKEQKVFIVSDHLKNDCCVDIVGAQHIQADVIVHFGYPCFSQDITNQELDIIHVLPKLKIDINESLQKIQDFISETQKQQVIIPDIEYLYLQSQFQQTLKTNDKAIFCGVYEKKLLENFLFYGYYSSSVIDKAQIKDLIIMSQNENPQIIEKIFFIKDHYSIQNIYHYNPLKNQILEINLNMNQPILKRLSLIEKAKNMQCFGLLILNPNTEFCQIILQKLRNILKIAKKKFFCFVMNCINEVKLNNFPEIDCYVVISCHNCTIIDYKKYFKVIISPYELMISLQKDFFPLYFVLDAKGLEFQDQEEIKEEEILDLSEIQNSLVSVNQNNQVAVASLFQTLEHFQGRRFQGLEIDQGMFQNYIHKKEKEVHLAQQGLKGIAQQYENEKPKK